jgi:hypothetical protein
MILDPCSEVSMQPLLYVSKKGSHDQLATANFGSFRGAFRISSRSNRNVVNKLSF